MVRNFASGYGAAKTKRSTTSYLLVGVFALTLTSLLASPAQAQPQPECILEDGGAVPCDGGFDPALDAGVPDAWVDDAAIMDAGVVDADLPDAEESPDADLPDAMPDADLPDAMPDAGPGEEGPDEASCTDGIDNNDDGDIDCDDANCMCMCDEPPNLPLAGGVRAGLEKTYDVKIGRVVVGATSIGGETTACDPNSLDCCTETRSSFTGYARVLFCNPLTGSCKGVVGGGSASAGEGWCSDTVCPDGTYSGPYECGGDTCESTEFAASGNAGFIVEQGFPDTYEWLSRWIEFKLQLIIAGEGRYFERSTAGANQDCSTPFGSCCANGTEKFSKGGQGGLTVRGRGSAKVKFLGKTWANLILEAKGCGALELSSGINCAAEPDNDWQLKWYFQFGMRVRTGINNGMICVGWGWLRTCFNIPRWFYKGGNASEASACAKVGL